MISATPGCSVPLSRIRAAAVLTIRSWLADLSSRGLGSWPTRGDLGVSEDRGLCARPGKYIVREAERDCARLLESGAGVVR
jgi:hypothetical protein